MYASNNSTKEIPMLYSFDNLFSPDVFQSWLAAARDQATLQLIAASSMQQQIEANFRKSVESSAMLLEQEMELPFAVVNGAQATKAKGAQSRGRSAHEPSRSKH
jgi:ABC-type uncharacterized transport system substrate-binding protein